MCSGLQKVGPRLDFLHCKEGQPPQVIMSEETFMLHRVLERHKLLSQITYMGTLFPLPAGCVTSALTVAKAQFLW